MCLSDAHENENKLSKNDPYVKKKSFQLGPNIFWEMKTSKKIKLNFGPGSNRGGKIRGPIEKKMGNFRPRNELTNKGNGVGTSYAVLRDQREVDGHGDRNH